MKAKVEEETRKQLGGSTGTQSKFFSNREKQSKEVSSLKMRIAELEKENSKLILTSAKSTS
jgi:hypothetical protein